MRTPIFLIEGRNPLPPAGAPASPISRKKDKREMKKRAGRHALMIYLAGALVLNTGPLCADSINVSEKTGYGSIPDSVAAGNRAGAAQSIPIPEGNDTPTGIIVRTSVNLDSYETRLAEFDARIARDPDDATLYIEKAIFQRMNLDVMGKIHTLEKALKRKNLRAEGSELADIHYDLAILYGPLGIYEKGYYHFLVLHQIDRNYFQRAQAGLEKYSGEFLGSGPAF